MSIALKNISYKYEQVSESHIGRQVLKGINLEIRSEEFLTIIGATGSGKSTLIQHLNLLLEAQEGDITYDGCSIYDKEFNRKALRSQVGLVFQYPEYQLFETDIYSDVSFGPKNLGLMQSEIDERVTNALELVGIKKEDYTRSPFELSGGQKRRVAIAGVLAMKPKYLVLDEPAAGLDPAGRVAMLKLLRKLHDEAGIGIVLVSHSMEDVAEYSDRVIVLSRGEIMYDASPREVFSHREELEAMGLAVPEATYVCDMLRRGGLNIPEGIITCEEAADAIARALGL